MRMLRISTEGGKKEFQEEYLEKNYLEGDIHGRLIADTRELTYQIKRLQSLQITNSIQ